MRTDILAKRDALATERIGDALTALSERYDVGADAVAAFASVGGRDKAVASMKRNEALADFLDALNDAQVTPAANASPDAILERLTAIPGIGEARAKQIIAALEGE